MEEGPQIERVTVFLRGTCHCEIYQRNSRDKRFPREACFEQGVVKVENVIVAFREEEEEDILVENALKLNATRCFSAAHATVRFPKGTFVTSDSRVKRALTRALLKWGKTL